ncbi:MAG: hypothetical protein ACYTHJ_05960 [Planctomycetota bacterium]|jgi:hypothetical protein
MTLDQKERTFVMLFCAVLLFVVNPASADVAPPVVIKMPRDTLEARSGEVFVGTFEIHVAKPGVLTDFRLDGEGWRVLSFEPPADSQFVQVGTLHVPFQAVPQDANRRIRLSFRYDGRKVSKAYELGPRYFDQVGKARPLMTVEAPLSDAPALPPWQVASEGVAASSGGAIPLQFTGRLVYTRSDGRVVGADHILVEVMDDDGLASDPLVDEVIAWGYTDENGYFDSGVIWWDDCDVVGCDEPDIYVRFECDTSIGQVQDPGVLEEDYSWSTMDDIYEDFTGNVIHFGTMSPSDIGQMAAVHIWNSLVRTHRFIEDVAGVASDHVDVQWPENDSSTSYYIEAFDEIYIVSDDSWREGTFVHEYGHHFLANHSVNTDPDYCNDYCDGEEVCEAGADCEDEGHCIWCPETDHDAWNEGFPNWLGDVIPRSFPARYQFDDCTPYEPVDGYNFETTEECCQDHAIHNPWVTEGFVAALLRDIDDQLDTAHDNADNDDEGSPPSTDCMALGAEEIFTVVTVDQPTTPSQFIAMIRSRYGQQIPGLWNTARNLHFEFLSAFPTDTEPPGPVTVVSSPTHPSGVGGASPCISVEFDQPSDDVTGSAGYSVAWTSDPGGVVPPENMNWPGGCVSQVTSTPRDFGTYYVSIRAKDWEDHWGPHETFGPFVINGDCNNNGIIDLCDIACDASSHAQMAGMQCTVSASFCNVSGCGTSGDCNLNLVPDDCDLASGISMDCDKNGVLDECDGEAGTLIHWADGNGSWNDPTNWFKLSECPEPPPPPTCDSPFPSVCPATPFSLDNVCVDVSGSDITVNFTNGTSDVGVLACYESLSISGSSLAHLRLFEPSWIYSDLNLSGNNSVLEVNDRLDIAGLFTWTGSNVTNSAALEGAGETHANGGLQVSEIVHLVDHHLILDGNSNSVSTNGRMEFAGASVVEIRPGSTYEHQGSTTIFKGWFDDNFVNGGTLIKSVHPGESSIYMHITNSGLIHVQAGTLKFFLGGSSSGDFLADSGALLEFTGGQEFLPGSSIIAEHIRFSSGISAVNTVRGTYDVSMATTVQGGSPVTFTDEANILSYGSSFFIPRGYVNFNAAIGGTILFDTLQLGAGGGSYAGTANFNTGDPLQVTTLDLGPGTIRSPGPITMSGLTTWYGAGHFDGDGTGVVNCNGDLLVSAASAEKTMRECVFNNSATATLLGQFSMSNMIAFNNLATGVIDIKADSGTSGSIISGLGEILNNAGTLVKSAGPGISTLSVPTINTGTVEVQAGLLRFYTHYNGYYTQNAGQTVLNGGDIFMFGPAPLLINGGLLTGAGTITGNVVNAGGSTAPGLSTGVLNIEGFYTQTTGGALEIEIAGLDQGVDYDWLNVSSVATLAGHLEVILPSNGFALVPGDSFQVLTADATVGEFEPVNVSNLPQFLNLEVFYTTHAVTLEIVAVVPGDCNLDGEADLADVQGLATCLSGPGSEINLDCRCFDYDDNGDVGLGDFAAFQIAFGGN